jgi:hypothetical protein
VSKFIIIIVVVVVVILKIKIIICVQSIQLIDSCVTSLKYRIFCHEALQTGHFEVAPFGHCKNNLHTPSVVEMMAEEEEEVDK